jgi:hypothetical protein
MNRTREEIEERRADAIKAIEQDRWNYEMSAESFVELCDQLLSLMPAAAPPELPEEWKPPFRIEEIEMEKDSEPSFFLLDSNDNEPDLNDELWLQRIAYALNAAYPAKEGK